MSIALLPGNSDHQLLSHGPERLVVWPAGSTSTAYTSGEGCGRARKPSTTGSDLAPRIAFPAVFHPGAGGHCEQEGNSGMDLTQRAREGTSHSSERTEAASLEQREGSKNAGKDWQNWSRWW